MSFGQQPPIFRVTVNDTDPIFFYCSAPGACIQGMIGVINPNSTFNYTTQLAFALNTTQEFSPGEYFPVESLPTRTTTATGATSIPSAASSATSTSSATAATASHSSSLSGGAIAGIAIGAAAVVILAGALIYMCGRQKSLGEIIRHSHPPAAHPGHNSYVAGPSGGMSEANYPNMQKTGHASVMSGQYSDQGYHGPATETESYRSMSPPIDERTGMMSVLHASSQHAMHLRNGQPSPGSPGSAAFPSPGYSTYNTNQTHEIDQSGGGLMYVATLTSSLEILNTDQHLDHTPSATQAHTSSPAQVPHPMSTAHDPSHLLTRNQDTDLTIKLIPYCGEDGPFRGAPD